MKTKRCSCDFCVKWYPIIRRIRRKLTGKTLDEFDLLVGYLMDEAENGDVAQAKLAGSWPGWDWLPAEIRKCRQNSRN